MKKFPLLFVFSLIFFVARSQTDTINDAKTKSLSPLLLKYSHSYDTLLIMHATGFKITDKPIWILGAKRKKWYLIKYYRMQSSLTQDSVVTHQSEIYKEIFDEVLKFNLLTLPSENVLKTPCQSEKDTVINGIKATEITSPANISDKILYTLEYKIGGIQGQVFYSDPEAALLICPESMERLDFVKIISLIGSL